MAEPGTARRPSRPHPECQRQPATVCLGALAEGWQGGRADGRGQPGQLPLYGPVGREVCRLGRRRRTPCSRHRGGRGSDGGSGHRGGGAGTENLRPLPAAATAARSAGPRIRRSETHSRAGKPLYARRSGRWIQRRRSDAGAAGHDRGRPGAGKRGEHAHARRDARWRDSRATATRLLRRWPRFLRRVER